MGMRRDRRVRVVATLVMVMATGGCWLQPGAGPGTTYANTLESALTTANVATLAEDWSVTSPTPVSAPVVNGGRLYMTDTRVDPEGPEDVVVVALDTASGQTAWERTVASAEGLGIGHPTFSGDELWVTHRNMSLAGPPTPPCAGAIERLDPDTGATVGVIDDVWASTPRTDGDTVTWRSVPLPDDCMSSFEGAVEVRDRGTLATRFTFVPPPREGFPDWPGEPIVHAGRVVESSGYGVRAFDAAGCGAPTCGPVWEVPATEEPGQYGVTRSQYQVRAAADGLVFASHHSYSVGRHGEVFSADHLEAYDAATGGRESGLGEGRTLGSALAVGGGRAFFTYRPWVPEDSPEIPEPRLVARPYGCGEECPASWYADVTSIGATLAVGGDVLYVSVPGGPIQAYDVDGCGATECSPLATITAPGTVGSMVISGGRLYVTSTTGSGHTLTAFAPTTP